MLARIRKAAENKDSGFTLIELLVVMIIIGILAAIAIPAFLSQKNKAKSTSAKADVSTIGKELAAYYVDNTGTVAVSSTGTTWSIGATTPITGKLSEGNKALGTATGAATGSADWCVTVWNTDVDGTATPAAEGNATWSYNQTSGLFKGFCSSAAGKGPALAP
jgi:type IV pilus assembly protein PilA